MQNKLKLYYILIETSKIKTSMQGIFYNKFTEGTKGVYFIKRYL